MSGQHDVVIVGAGILGLASAYHILRQHIDLDLLVVDRLDGPGRGNTTKSAAAYRDMFTSPVNRRLAQGSIHFYEGLQERKRNLGLRRIGYLWLMDDEQFSRTKEALEYMAHAGVVFEVMDQFDLAKHLHGFESGDIIRGVLGSRCGILNQNNLTEFYHKEVERLGAKFAFGTKVTGLLFDDKKDVVGVKTGEKELQAKVTVVATGAWMGALMGGAGIDVPVVPKKRQLFSVKAKGEALKKLYSAKGFNAHGLLPFTIVPGGAYLRPGANAFIAGYADEEREPGIEDDPKADREFYDKRVLPPIAKYFPAFAGTVPEQSWAGHYAYHPPDNVPFVARVHGAILVGGDSGSGIMKADSIGRVAAGLYADRKQVDLADGKFFKVADLGLEKRKVEKEELLI
jgi:glycine/D-amino acid oxidase-like deaminating enzyme